MTGTERLSRSADHLGSIRRTLGDLHGPRTVVHELIQNSDDAPGATRMRFTVTAGSLEVWNDGVFDRCDDVTADECGWLADKLHRCDFHSFRKIGSGDKRNRPGTTGAFGVGFTAVYQLTDKPELVSNGEHWIIDETAPEADRITRRRHTAPASGTTFRLPWARQNSAFRVATGQTVIDDAAVDTFARELIDAVPLAMLFLKKLQQIEVVTPTRQQTFTRTIDGPSIRIEASGGSQREWFVVQGNFSDEAESLKRQYPEQIEPTRSPIVTLAFPLDGHVGAGFLYASLPTEESSHLPLLINADLVPASDRKRIRFDDAPESAWNRAAIRRAAQLLADSIETLPDALGDVAFVRLVLQCRELAGRTGSGEVDESFGVFWTTVAEALPIARVVPTSSQSYESTATARLWSEAEELASTGLLGELGISLVAEHVRGEWFSLQSRDLGLRTLSLADVAEVLRTQGITGRRTLDEMPEVLASEDDLRRLWQVLDALLRTPSRSSVESRASLRTLAVLPGWDGALWPPEDVYTAEVATQDMLADVGADCVFLDDERLGTETPQLAAFANPTTAANVLDWLEVALDPSGPTGDGDVRQVLAWLHDHRAQIHDARPRVAALPIFPTHAGAQPLLGLALPSEFQDPLGLARVVQTDGIEDMRPFLRALGARQLSLTTYCTDHIPAAVASGELVDAQRRGLGKLLATKLSEIRDNTHVRDALQPLDIVPRTDGAWRAGSDVYADRGVSAVVGPDIHIAEPPSERHGAYSDLYRWLGVATDPRATDVIARCRQIETHRGGDPGAAEAIIRYVGKRHNTDPTRTSGEYAALRGIAWLPVAGNSSRTFRPSEVRTLFRQSLFASQGAFLGVPLTAQREAAEFLAWLGVESEPEPEQVVAHLLWSADNGTEVRGDMWPYLNQQANDPALDKLVGKQCLLLDNGTYVKPSEVYWEAHPFGRWRFVLGPEFGQWRALLDRLEVPARPSPVDAIDVLLDVATRHGGENAPLLADDVPVVQACWKLLSEGLEGDDVDPAALGSLTSAEVVLDSANRLCKPSRLFFRDVSLAKRFGREVNALLIDRPEGAWSALAAAGVRNLSDAVSTDIVEIDDAAGEGQVRERLRERRQLLLRVLGADDDGALSRLDQFDADVEVRSLTTLVIQQTLDLDGELHPSVPFERGALFQASESTLLCLDGPGREPVWSEVAREVVRALHVDGRSSPHAASAVKVVLGASTTDEAQRELDELGFSELDVLHIPEIAASVASGFGGDAVAEADDRCERAPVETNNESSAPPGSTGAASDSDPGGHRGAAGGERTTGSDGPGRAGEGVESGGRSEGRSEGGRSSSTSSGSRSRLVSYVVPADAPSASTSDASADGDDEVERAGVDAVLAFERAHGREPSEMPVNNPGYDIRSVDSAGRVRVIEVKATRGSWGPTGVRMSSTQYRTAQDRGEEFWLYVVDEALTAPKVHPINDPAAKVDLYVFDHGWRSVEERAHSEPRPPLPALPVTTERGAPSGTVLLVDPDSGATTLDANRRWVGCSDPSRGDSWFAVQIAGDSLGMGYFGGIAYVAPLDGGPEDDELLLVRLHDQIDPDTGRRTAIRRWAPERDQAGQLLAIRLRSDSSVEPLTVMHPEHLEILGRVCALARADDLVDS